MVYASFISNQNHTKIQHKTRDVCKEKAIFTLLIRWFISIEEKRDLKERLGYSETGTNQLHWNGDRGQFPKHFFPQGSGNGH